MRFLKAISKSLAGALDLLPQKSAGFDCSSCTNKAQHFKKVESIITQSQYWDFFSDESAEFIDLDEGTGFGLWWARWECLGSLYQLERDRLVMDADNPADSLFPQSF